VAANSTEFGSRRRRVAIICVLSLALGACQQIGGRTISVEFENAEGLRGGEHVYFSGVEIGRTGAPQIVQGRARVPVYLYRNQRDAVTPGSVFIVTEDPRKEKTLCLEGYAVHFPTPTTPGTEQVYHGVSSEVELAVLLGADRARELWEQLQQ
jgi:MlaD protein